MNGPQALALNDLLLYLDHRGISQEDDREEFIYLVQRLDQRFIADSIARSRSNHPPKPHGKPPR
jgi:hypothetical protein